MKNFYKIFYFFIMSFFAILVSFEKENNGIKKAKINRIFCLIKNKILNNVNISPSGNVIIPGSFQVGANTTLGGDLIVLGLNINFSSIGGSGAYLGIDENGNLYKTTGGGGGVPDPLSIGTIQSTASDSILYINSNTGQDFTNGPTYIGTVDKDLILNGVIAITGNTSIAGDTNITGNLQTNNSGTISSAGALSVLSGGASITGNTSITGDAAIAGNTNITGNLQTNNSGTISSAGALSVLSGGASITGTTSITGDAAIAGNTNITGNLQTNNSGTISSAGALSVLSGGASITGNTSITGDAAIAGNTNITGNLQTSSGGTITSAGTLSVLSGGASLVGDTNIVGDVNINFSGDKNTNIGNSENGGLIAIKTNESNIDISTTTSSINSGNININSAGNLKLESDNIVFIGKNFPQNLGSDCNVIINSSSSNSVLINCGYENVGGGNIEIGTDYNSQTSDSSVAIGGANSHIYLKSAEIIPPIGGINKILYIDNDNKITTTDYGETSKLRINLQTNKLTTNLSDEPLYINKYNVITTKVDDPTEYDKQYSNLDSYPDSAFLYINAIGEQQPVPPFTLGNTIIGNNSNDLYLYGDTEINADLYGQGSYTKIGYYLAGETSSGSGEVSIKSFNNPIQLNSYGSSEVLINTDNGSAETEIGNYLNEVAIFGNYININNNSSDCVTNVGTGITNGNVKIGNSLNQVLIGNTTASLASTADVNIASSGADSIDINANNGSAVTNIGTGSTTGAVNLGSALTVGQYQISLLKNNNNYNTYIDSYGSSGNTYIGYNSANWIYIGSYNDNKKYNKVIIGKNNINVGEAIGIKIDSNGSDSIDINCNNASASTHIGAGSTFGEVIIGNASNRVLIGNTDLTIGGSVDINIASNLTDSVNINVDNGAAVTNIGTGSTTGAVNLGSALTVGQYQINLLKNNNNYNTYIDSYGSSGNTYIGYNSANWIYIGSGGGLVIMPQLKKRDCTDPLDGGTYAQHKVGNISVTTGGALYIDTSGCDNTAEGELKSCFENNILKINDQILSIESNINISNEKIRFLEEKIINLEKVNKNIIEKNKKLEKLIKNIQEKKEKEYQN